MPVMPIVMARCAVSEVVSAEHIPLFGPSVKIALLLKLV
jgi:hypothetical protein